MKHVALEPARPGEGCTECGSRQTVTLDSRFGRRCIAHPPSFDPAFAVSVALYDLGAAADYVRAMFPEEAS